MDEKRLWAPWRLGYITGGERYEPACTPTRWAEGADHGCFLCRAAAQYDDPAAADAENLVALRSDACQVVLNRYPYSNGHLLVSPLRPVGALTDLTDAEHLRLMQTLTRMKQALADKLNAVGFNVGLNLGRVAGAGLPGHLHWHIVPRWSGDTNFMPAISGVKVMPQALEALWEVLRDANAAPDGG